MQIIEEKIKSITAFFRNREISEQAAIISTVLVFVLILTTFFLIVSFVLPKTKLEISISGPRTAKAGEEVTYQVICKNNGNVILKEPELVFHFPSSSLPEKSLIETIKLDEDLYPNQTKEFTFKARFFSAEGESHEMKSWINYYTKKNSSVMMSEVAYFSTTISEVPIDLVLDIPQKIPVSPNEELTSTFRVRYFSSENIPAERLKLSMNLPQEFVLQESIPERKADYEFDIPVLDQTRRGEIEIIGSFPTVREIGQTLNFDAELFIELNGFNISLKKSSSSALTYEPNFVFSQKINNKERYYPSVGEKLHYEIYFKNIKDEALSNLNLSTVLEGNFFDLSTIDVPLGSFSQGSRSISWSGENVDQLKYLTPGEEGKVEFWVNMKKDYVPQDITETNTSIKNRVILAGFENEFRSRISSLVKITQEVYFNDIYKYFSNTGEHPPKVDRATYYTVVWKLENYYNAIENILVKASLPKGVSFRSVKNSQGEVSVLTKTEGGSSDSYDNIPSNFKFENSLYQGSTNNEVKYMQLILKNEVPSVYPQDVPVSGYFGSITLQSVKAFQEKYSKEILEAEGLWQATGNVDEPTRKKLNEILTAGRVTGSSEVVWQIEKVNPGKGAWEDPLIAAFQIAFIPNSSQLGQTADLMGEVSLSARDQWTGMNISTSDEAIDTTLPDDSTIKKGEVR
jgi:peptidoglycan hydrolase-like protein with peptidoglycan-binding domain